MPRWEVLFDGFTEDEILRRAAETIEGLIVLGEPLVFRVGSATFSALSNSVRVDS
jgi:hypothetical protein